ncbi:DUF1878 family protein [Virgibacillus halophilus]
MRASEDDQIAFHLQLLMNIIDFSRYPFTKMIIENRVGRQTYQDLMEKLYELEQQYQYQKEEGLLDYSSLLQEFTAHLPRQLTAEETLAALKAENICPMLISEFCQIILEKDDRLSRLRSRKRKRVMKEGRRK